MKHNNIWRKTIEPGTQIGLIQHHNRVRTRWRSPGVTANYTLMVFILKDRGLVGLSQIVVIGCELWPAWIPNDILLYIMQCNIVKYQKLTSTITWGGEKKKY